MSWTPELHERFYRLRSIAPRLVHDSELAGLISEALELFERLEELEERTDRSAESAELSRRDAHRAFELLDRLIAEGTDTELLGWVKDAADRVVRVGPAIRTQDITVADRLDDLMGAARHIARQSSTMADERTVQRVLAAAVAAQEAAAGAADQAQESAGVADSAADKAQVSAGIAGGSSLAEHFVNYADDERTAANWFRSFAIASIVAAPAAVVALGPLGDADWTGLTYRAAIALGAGTLAAYFARQAGQHRRMYNWAKSMAVQLTSFPAFIEPVPGNERADIYRTFARRVLGAPPDKNADANDENLGAAQVVDLMATFIKKGGSANP